MQRSLGPLHTAAAGTALLCAQEAGPPPGPQAHMEPTLKEHMSSLPRLKPKSTGLQVGLAVDMGGRSRAASAQLPEP